VAWKLWRKKGEKQWPTKSGWEHVVPESSDCWHAGATQEALVEQYNDQLRELREAGLSEQAEEVREALRALRDEERAPESSVKVRLPFLRVLLLVCMLFSMNRRLSCCNTDLYTGYMLQSCCQSEVWFCAGLVTAMQALCALPKQLIFS